MPSTVCGTRNSAVTERGSFMVLTFDWGSSKDANKCLEGAGKSNIENSYEEIKTGSVAGSAMMELRAEGVEEASEGKLASE